ncbi:FG-GAP repeat protein [Luteimonas galliterrae]|nr:FG-GAP repeat protein [Luteimonas galliterrae]
MDNKRRTDGINLGALYGVSRPDTDCLPRPDPIRGPVFVSREESLRRDLENINVRTVAELGPMLPGGLPVAPKRKHVPPQSTPMPEHGQANFGYQEDETMKLSHVVVVTAVAAGIVACDPSAGTEETPPPQALSLSTSEAQKLSSDMTEAQQERATTSPISANAAINESGKLKVEAGDTTLRLEASGCSKQSGTLTICNERVNLYIEKTDINFSQRLLLESVYVDSKETFYRGALDKSNCHTFILADVNGDGQEDLIVQTGNEGGYGGPSFSVYLFDMKDKLFKFNKLFSDLTIGTISLFIVEKGKLKTWAKNGCCEHFYLTYEIRKNRPVLTEMITERSTDKGVETIVERLVNGEMKEIVE